MSPAKNFSRDALAGVEGTVACAAGPRAAPRGVAGIWMDCGDEPFVAAGVDIAEVVLSEEAERC